MDWLALPLSLFAVYGANVVRIAFLLVLGRFFSVDVALGGFHSKAGWVLFSAVVLGVIAALRARAAHRRGERAPSAPNPAAPYLVPLLALLAASLVTGLFQASGAPEPILVAVAGAAALVWASRRAPLAEGPPAWGLATVAGLVAWAAWIALLPDSDPEAVQRALTELESWSPLRRGAWWAARVVVSVVLVPAAEELAFRGWLQRRWAAREFETLDPRGLRMLPWAGASLAFGLAHSTPVAGVAAGLVYGAVYAARGRLVDAIWAHAVTNAVIAVQVGVFGAWWLWF